MFLRLLSQLYQDLGPIDPPPYYEPEAIKFRDPLETPSHIFHIYHPPTPPWEHPERKLMEFVAFRLTATQLAEIHNTIAKGTEHLRISRVDVVVALLALCLSETEPEAKPIDTISYVINVRLMIYPSFPHFDLSHNSTGGWAYIRKMQSSTQSFGSLWGFKARTSIPVTVFWPVSPKYGSHWGG